MKIPQPHHIKQQSRKTICIIYESFFRENRETLSIKTNLGICMASGIIKIFSTNFVVDKEQSVLTKSMPFILFLEKIQIVN